jgi:putative transposase
MLEGIKEFVDETIRMLCEWKKMGTLELNVQKDHVHVVLEIAPKVSVSEAMGMLKGKSAIKIFQHFPGMKKKPYWGNHFWARGYCVSTVGIDEKTIRKYVAYQEKQEKMAEAQQLNFGF